MTTEKVYKKLAIKAFTKLQQSSSVKGSFQNHSLKFSQKTRKHTTYIDVVETSGAGVSLLGGSPGGAILPVQMRQLRSNK